jgi:putative tryptophan/tyrosine transport system substrate-binding protein
MKKTTVLSILVVAVQLTIGVVAEAQQPTKIPRIGFLNANSPSIVAARLDAFRQGLREVGYWRGQILSLNIGGPRGK